MKRFARRIIFISIPHIFIEGERLRREWDEKTVCVVASSEGGTGMIIDFPECFGRGIRKGMLLKDARLKGDVNIIGVDYDYMKEVNRMVIDYLKKYSIVVESNYFGGFYIDLTGTERLFGRIMDTCGRIVSEINRLYGFGVQAGIGGNKLVSYVAAKIAGRNSVYEICRDSESIFLAPVRISRLPDIPWEIRKEILSSYNIRTVRELAAFSGPDLKALFRKHGDLLYAYSRNIAPDFLTAGKEEKIIAGAAALAAAPNEDRVIRRKFFHLVLDLCADMRRENVFPLRFDLKIIYRDGYRYSKSRKVSEPSFIEKKLYDFILPDLESALVRRTCMKKLTLSFFDFVPAAVQQSLFGDDRDLKLSLAFDSIRDRFGKRGIYFAE